MNNPRMITPGHIITERHKAEDIIKRFGQWHKIRQFVYRGTIFWEIVK